MSGTKYSSKDPSGVRVKAREIGVWEGYLWESLRRDKRGQCA